MGGAQSAQRDDKQDPTAEEESGKVEDTQTAQHIEDKSLKNNEQISEISGKADDVIAEVNGHCEDEIAAEAVVSPDEAVSEAEKPLKEETHLENLEINKNESPDVADTTEEVPLEMTEIDAKQNDINESFIRFVSNINLKLTVKRGSAEKDDIAADVPDDTTREEPNRPEGIKDNAKENESENAENNAALNAAQETYDQNSICPTQTDITSEEVLDNSEEKATESKDDVYIVNVPTIPSPVGEDERVQQNATSEEEVVVSPIKRFFTTGIFSGLRKKKKPAEDETTEKEMLDIRKVEAIEATEQTVDILEHDKEISLGIEAVKVETEHKENGLKEQILRSAASAQITDEGKSHSTDTSTIIVNEPEILSSQEKDKVHASPLKRLLSGSSLKKSSKKQRERKSSNAQLSDTGEHVSNQLLSSTDAVDSQKEETSAGEEDGAWASFKKLVTPKKHVKRSSLTNEETKNPSSVQESKSSEGEQISDDSTEESKKRKESSVSWEAVLCGSGRRRRSQSRKTSDSEEEKPQIDNDNKTQESPLDSSNEIDESLASYVKQAGSHSEGDGGSTWKSFKKLVTPHKKGKDEDIQSDGEVTQDDSSFSIKRLLPKQKKRRPVEKQDYVSSDEADKEVASGDEDSETPAVVPLSEFDTAETVICLQTHADIESHVPKEADYELQQDLEKIAEPVLLCDTLQSEAKNVQEDALETEKSTTPASNEELDEITELISKHQQLSDIPEEGIITESMVTPASVTEEPARDDTIAEDFVEITSEAITALEPVDITLADETELISAVSHLSDSSNTSGNTTPVPAEYDIKDTEVILQHAVENISISPEAIPLCSDEINSETIAASVSYQILETIVKQQPTILEIHKKSDATAINLGLNVEELDAINELAATAQTENIMEVSEAVSTEIASEVSTEFDTAEISMDQIHEVIITEESIKELERTTESQDLMECQVYEAASTEILPEGEKTVECSQVDTRQAETETLQTDIQEAETKYGGVEQEVQTVLERKDEIMQNITDQDHPPEVAQELQALATVEANKLKSEKAIGKSKPTKPTSEDILATETVIDEPKKENKPFIEVNVEPERVDELQAVHEAVLDSELDNIPGRKVQLSDGITQEEADTDEPKGETKPVTEVHVEPEKEGELQAHTANTEHAQVPEVLTVHKAALDSQVQLSEKIISEETIKDEPKEETKSVTEVNVKPENEDERQADADKTKHGEVPAVLPEQAAVLDSEMGHFQPGRRVLLLEDITQAETVGVNQKGQPEPLTEDTVQPEKEADLPKIEHIQVPQVLGDVKPTALASLISSIQIPEQDVSEDIPPEEAVPDEPKEETEPVTEVNVESEKKDELQADDAKAEHTEVPEVVAVHTAALDSQISRIHIAEKEVQLSQDIPPGGAVTDEPSNQSEPLDEVHGVPEKEDELQGDADKTDYGQVQEVLTVQAAALDSELGSIQTPGRKIPLSEDITPEEMYTSEPQEETECLTEVNVEPVDASKTENVQEAEVFEAVQVVKISSEESSVVSLEKIVTEETRPTETITNEPTKATEVNSEPEEEILGEDVLPVLPCDAKEIVTETEAVKGRSISGHVTESVNRVSAPETKEQEDICQPDTDYVIASVTGEIESEMAAELNQELEINKAQTTEIIPQEVQVEQEDRIPENVDKLLTLSAVQVSSVSEESSRALFLEKKVISEETPVPSVNHATATYEFKYEVHFSEVQDNVEVEKEAVLPGAETKTSTVEHAVVGQVITCNLKEVSVAIPDVLTEKGSDLLEPLIDKVASELDLKEEAEIATPLEKDERIRLVVDKLQTSAVQVSSVSEESIKAPVLEKKVISEETSADCVNNATATYECKYEVHFTKLQGNVEVEKEAVLPGAETKTSTVEHAVVGQVITSNPKEVSVSIPDVLTEKSSDLLEPLIDKVASELDLKEEAEIATPLEKDERIRLVVDKLQTSAVQVSSVSEESSRALFLEKKVISEETPVPSVNHATATYEFKYEVHFSEVQGNVEGEKEAVLPDAEIKTSTVEHAVVGQVITSNPKEVSVLIPDVLIEKSSDLLEPLIDKVASELDLKEEAEIATPLERDDVTETATEHSVVVMMHVPSAEFEDNHRIQVQVVEVDLKSAEMMVDSGEVGVTEAKEVIDVCHETLKIIDKLSATETEEELINEENKMINHNAIQHVKENLAERALSIKDEAVKLRHKKQLDVTELSTVSESKSNEVENQKVIVDTSDTFSQKQDEVPVISDDPAAEQLESKDVVQTPNIPDSSSGNVSIHDHKEDLAKVKKTEADAEAQTLQSSQSQTIILNKTGLEVPQNTGIFSSMGNMESPSSLSLEFKLNIQFGQAKAPASPPLATEKTEASPSPATERTETVNQTKVVGVQAEEPEKLINATNEKQRKTVLTEVTVQATEITETKCGNLDSTERAAIINQPVLLDISIQAMETVQTAEQIVSTETLSPNVQATEKLQEEMHIKESKDFLGHPVLYEACSEEINVEELQVEEDNDQDLWVDAEEDIHTQEESDMSIFKVEGTTVHQTESDQEEKTGLEYEFEMAPEMAPKSKTKEEENQQEMHKMEETCETENEGEEFAVALEHPETSTTAGIERD